MLWTGFTGRFWSNFEARMVKFGRSLKQTRRPDLLHASREPPPDSSKTLSRGCGLSARPKAFMSHPSVSAPSLHPGPCAGSTAGRTTDQRGWALGLERRRLDARTPRRASRAAAAATPQRRRAVAAPSFRRSGGAATQIAAVRWCCQPV